MKAAVVTDTILIKGKNTEHRLCSSSVEYLEARGFCVFIKLSDGEVLETVEPLRTLESKLDIADGFYKCHRRYIVNINYVHTFTSDEITMRSGCRIPISRKCKTDFKDAFFSVISFRK